MEPLAVGADALGEHGLDVHVDILVLHGEFHLAVLNVLEDGGQTVYNVVGLLLGDNPLPPQHGGMGQRALDVLLVHPLVKQNGGVKVVYLGIRLLLKPSCP